ncbi:MAG: hypothetical protein ACR2L3_03120 [Actinomycetota bacterium]
MSSATWSTASAIPGEVEGLLYIVRVRALARQAGVRQIKLDGPTITIQMLASRRLDRALERQLPANSRMGPTQVHLDRAVARG